MQENDTKKVLHCDECEQEIPLGCDLISVKRAVLGPRGVILLGEESAFCSERCVSRFFDQDVVGDLPEISRRIP